MKTICIISPDPESMRALGLAFELGQWRVRYATCITSTPREPVDAVLFDMADGIMKLPLKKKVPNASKCIAIAPRGACDADIAKIIPHTDLLIKRPYELMHLTRAITDLFDGD
jgi:hypothetical protein